MSIDIRIEFENNPEGVYYSGQLLRGKVHLTVHEQKKVRGVYIRIYGKAHASWSKRSGKQTHYYEGNERYIDETTYLVGAPEGTVRLTPGSEVYNFQCNLPDQLPTSVEGYYGYIRYTARVTVDIPMAIDKELKQRFTVIRPLNLNASPELRRKVISASSESDCCTVFCCCCCILMSPIEVAAEIPVGGYTPGQTINLDLRVNHEGSAKDYDFDVKLMKRIDLYANDTSPLNCCGVEDHKKETQCITEKVVNKHISNTEVVRVNLMVPPVPPTDFTSSTVVKVTYYLKISSSTGMCSGSPKNRIPLTIGTYPIQDATALVQSDGPSPTAPLLGSTDATDLPTYEEAMDMVDTGGDKYKPKYPVFKRATSYSSGN